jgi:hypothetical protein
MLNIFNNVLSTAEISFNSTMSSSFSEISSLPAKELVSSRESIVGHRISVLGDHSIYVVGYSGQYGARQSEDRERRGR